MIVIGSVVDWALSELIKNDGGAVTKEPANCVGVAARGCEVEGRCAVLVSQAQVHPLLGHLVGERGDVDR